MILLPLLNVANCGHPDLLLWSVGNDSIPSIEGYDGLPIEGSTVTIKFSCPLGLALNGPNSAICTENGRWKPNPNSWPTCVESKGYLL